MTEFRELNIGDNFNFDRGIETGLLTHMGTAGTIVYTKTSARKYTRQPDGQEFKVGSGKARVWRTP